MLYEMYLELLMLVVVLYRKFEGWNKIDVDNLFLSVVMFDHLLSSALKPTNATASSLDRVFRDFLLGGLLR